MFFTLSIVYLAFIYSAKGQAYKYDCPDSMTYCTCSSSTIDTCFKNGQPPDSLQTQLKITVTCNNFNGNTNDFSDGFTELANLYIDELIIVGYKLEELPDNIFLMDNKNPISLIKKITIKDSPNLAYIGYADSNFTFFEGLGLSLEELYIENTNIGANEWTRVAKSLTTESVLRTLTLYKNDFSSYTSFDIFNAFPNIKKINMRQNKLNSISANLAAFPKLQILDLCYNQIRNFELTGNSTQMSTIYLRNNEIQYIRTSVLNSLGSIRLIDLTGNPLSCFCEDVRDIVGKPEILSILRGNCVIPQVVANRPLNDEELSELVC